MRRIRAAGAVVRDADGRFLLVLRTKEPEAGVWTVPGGSVESGESFAQAAAREVLEETGLVVRVLHELWTVDVPFGDDAVYEIHDFLAAPVSGRLQAGDDAGDARWFTPGEMRDIPLTHDLLGYFTRAGLSDEPA